MTNRFTTVFIIGFSYFLVLFSTAYSQETSQDKNIDIGSSIINKPPSLEKSVDKALLLETAMEMMKATKLCALITRDSIDQIHVRTMQPFPPEKNLVVWLGTNVKSRKVNDIKNNPDVVLYYNMQDASGYVVLYGKANLIDDPVSKSKYWMNEWKDFYPDKSLYLLIRFTPDSLEILNTKKGIFGDQKTWKVPSINIE